MTKNEALVRDFVDAFNSGDMERFLAFVDPHARFYPVDFFPDLEPLYEGREGLVRAIDGWRGPWDRLRAEIGNLDEEDDIVAFDAHWIGERAGAPSVDMSLGTAIAQRDGLVTLLVYALTAAEARARLLTIGL
jgi:hypothetical protein